MNGISQRAFSALRLLLLPRSRFHDLRASWQEIRGSVVERSAVLRTG
jgi:hypothetical protein